jgi:hypothetical protein
MTTTPVGYFRDIFGQCKSTSLYTFAKRSTWLISALLVIGTHKTEKDSEAHKVWDLTHMVLDRFADLIHFVGI